MITTVKSGKYKLQTSVDGARILQLDKNTYIWIFVGGIGELLIYPKNVHKASSILNYGNYRIYNIVDEPELVDLQHLELEVKRGVWQSYLLLTGLPTKSKTRSRIIPSTDTVASNPEYRKHIVKMHRNTKSKYLELAN